MNYKEALLFIGKCLTLSRESKHKDFVISKIDAEEVNWDKIVQVSTAHYVFPTLYLNLSSAKLLFLLPDDLVAYMKHITHLNRERNEEILKQAKEIHQLLSKSDIISVFLKGTGFLMQHIYHDQGERMIGDIDLLVEKKDFQKTIHLLKEFGYHEKNSLDRTFVNRHYTGLIHPNRTAAVEVHHSMTSQPYRKKFNFHTVKPTLITTEYGTVLSLEDQLLMTLYNKQINDHGQYYKSIALRSTYDIFVLSHKINSLKTVQKLGTHFDILNHGLASAQFVLDSSKILFEENSASKKFIETQNDFLQHPEKEKKNRQKWNRRLAIRGKLRLFSKLFYDVRAWKYLFQRSTT
jgi:hypothetical protein